MLLKKGYERNTYKINNLEILIQLVELLIDLCNKYFEKKITKYFVMKLLICRKTTQLS